MTQAWLFPEDEINDYRAIQAEVKEPEFSTIPECKKTRRTKEKQEALFTKEELVQPPLTAEERECLIRRIVSNAKLGARYMYRAKEVCSMLHITYDEIQTLLNYYKLDCVVIRETIIRIPWWSLAEYLIDPAEDVETAFYAYLKTLPHRDPEEKKTA